MTVVCLSCPPPSPHSCSHVCTKEFGNVNLHSCEFVSLTGKSLSKQGQIITANASALNHPPTLSSKQLFGPNVFVSCFSLLASQAAGMLSHPHPPPPPHTHPPCPIPSTPFQLTVPEFLSSRAGNVALPTRRK